MAGSELTELREAVLRCEKCPLSKTRKKVIFGEGNPSAAIMLIAEAPGRDEDIQGRPFVGKSGQLLDKILGACGFSRQEHIYISNIVKCHPPSNRNPEESEARTCLPWLLRQIEIIDPRILILLGSVSLKYMMGPEYRISKVHGTWLSRDNRLVLPFFHPAALLRNPSLKKDTWEDCKKLIDRYRELVDAAHHSPHYS
jgi:uracil-DNA glycosylase